jgi:hypothetical protein
LDLGYKIWCLVTQAEIENPGAEALCKVSSTKQFSDLSDVESGRTRKVDTVKRFLTAVVLSAILFCTTPQPQLNNQVHVESVARTAKAASITADKQTVSAATPEKVAQAETPKITATTVIAPEPLQPPVTQEVAQPSITDAEAEAKAFIYHKESSNNPAAENYLGCYGLGQDCNGIVKKKCGADYTCQDAFFTDYMARRYGSWSKAKAFWLASVDINGKEVGNWW